MITLREPNPEDAPMASITIRNLEDELKARLRVQAASHGRSMEDEVRVILREAVGSSGEKAGDWIRRVRERFAPYGGVELPIPPREAISEPPDFSDPEVYDPSVSKR